MQRLITFIISILMSLISLIFPVKEEKPFECETIEIGGVTYQNGVVSENMHLKGKYNFYDEKAIHSDYVFTHSETPPFSGGVLLLYLQYFSES